MSQRSSSGGAAAAAGAEFQHRVAAYFAVTILAENDASPPLGLSAETTLDWLRCETGLPVDDLLIGTSDGGLILVQVKRSLDLSNSEHSELAKTIDQFVRQFVLYRGKSAGNQPWERALDVARDRLTLVTSPRSPESIRRHLSAVLRRARQPIGNSDLDIPAVNAGDERALRVLLAHLVASWQRVVGATPSDQDKRELLALIHVEILDVEDGPAERAAKTLLRNSVLSNPDQSEAAWAVIVTTCATLATNRGGANRRVFQQALETARIRTKTPRGILADVELLRSVSRQTRESLAGRAEMQVGPDVVRIRRSSFESLKQAVENGSILIVGEPGVGKSSVILDLIQDFIVNQSDFLCLDVNQLAARTLNELHQELGLSRPVLEVLDNWQGGNPAYVVIDALDAARGEIASTMIRELINQVLSRKGRWRVVASIRKFDLRYGDEIRQLFVGQPPTDFVDPEFAAILHFNVPPLTDDELAQVALQSFQLGGLIDAVPTPFRELLRIPFNLNLAARLLGAGTSVRDLSPITTQLELLDRYWSSRVIRADRLGDAREAVLRRATEGMVAGRALRISRAEVAEASDSLFLGDLLSGQVLVEWQASLQARPTRSILAYSHNILFDYAASRLLLGDAGEEMTRRLSDDRDLSLVIRPSILFSFCRSWASDRGRELFWDLVFRVIQENRIPEIGKLIGPAVAAELASSLADLEQLCSHLEAPLSTRRSEAQLGLQHLVGTLLATSSAERPLTGPNSGPWCQFLERITRDLRVEYVYPVRALVSAICDRPDGLSRSERESIGCAARRLLAFAWSLPKRDGWLAISALQAVCRTYDSDRSGSSALVRRSLQPDHLSTHGFEELPWLAREVTRLISLDAALVEEIYRAAFTFQESSDSTTTIGQSRIFGLTSNRRQDYRMGLYELAQVFPTFLEQAETCAVRALAAAIEAYAVGRHNMKPGAVQEQTFDFDGQVAVVRSDHSAIWDEGEAYRHDEPIKMLAALQQRLEKLSQAPQEDGTLRGLVQHLVAENRLAVVWRRVLEIATSHPKTLGAIVLPLAWSMPILTSFDTTTAAGTFLRSVYPTCDRETRERIERAVLRIPESLPGDLYKAGLHVRNRLLGCLEREGLVTEDARRLRDELSQGEGIPPNVPPVRFTFSSSKYGEEEYLREQGVPIDTEPNREIRGLERSVKDFADRHLNSTPNLEELSSILPHLQALHSALLAAESSGVHPLQRVHAWDSLAAACARCARSDVERAESPATEFVRHVLLEAAGHAVPVADAAGDAHFDESPSWGSPAPRIRAAEGLVALARSPRLATADVLIAIDALSRDPVPAVRYQIAVYVNVLARAASTEMWTIIGRMASSEASYGVLQGLLSGPLQLLASSSADRVAQLTNEIFRRISPGPGAKAVRGFCVSIFANLYIWRSNVMSADVVLGIASTPLTHTDDAAQLVAHLREPLTHGPISPSDPIQDAVRQHALDLLDRILRSARAALAQLEEDQKGEQFDRWPEADRESARALVKLIDHLGTEVYFASGAYEITQAATVPHAARVSEERAERFYREADSVLTSLAEVGIPSVTHHLLETIEVFVETDPRGVFLRVGRVVREGRKGGYQYESQAVDLIVRLVERYLAEFRELFRDDSECRAALIEVLDEFVKAGWPSARRLAYHLEEMFR